MKILFLPMAILFVFVSLSSCRKPTQTVNERQLVQNKQTNAHQENVTTKSYLFQPPAASDGQYMCCIRAGESRDTTVTIERDTIIDFNWIFRQLFKIQQVGREMVGPREEWYSGKFLKYFPSPSQGEYINRKEVNQFVNNPSQDTIFVDETISKDGSYKIYYWRNLKNFHYITLNGETRKWDVVSRDVSDVKVYNLINSWQKDTILKYGKNMMPPDGRWNSNPNSSCSSRIIITPDSVRIDMIKYYPLYGLKFRD